MSPPLRDPGRVGSTSRTRAPVASAPDLIEASTRSWSSGTTSRSRVTLYIAEPVDVGGGSSERPSPLDEQFVYLRPPFAQCRVRPAPPRHLPPCLRTGQGPGDRDGVGEFLGPDRRAHQHTTQRHAAVAGPWRVLGKVGVYDRSGVPGLGNHPVDDEYPTVGHGSTKQSGQLPTGPLPGLLSDAERGHRHEPMDAAFED